MTTFVFPGQGSQSRGMGKALFTEFPNYVQQANAILGYSIEALCLEDPENQLNQTNYTQPALYVVNALSYLKKIKETKTSANFLAGHSLGEYNALFAAQVFDFETGLKLVQKRGQLMAQAVGGGMAAIIGLEAEKIQTLLQENRLDSVSIANFNSNTQAVITGPLEQVKASEALWLEAGASLFIPLKVSGAFHSKYMDEAYREFAAFLSNFHFSAPKVPVIANVNAKPYEANEIATQLALQINHPVCWLQSIQYLISQGETVFEELGPGKVLMGLISRIQKGQ